MRSRESRVTRRAIVVCLLALLVLNAVGGSARAQGSGQDVMYQYSNGEWGVHVEPRRLGPPYVETYPAGGVASGPTFTVEYLDVTNDTNVGFDDPALGATRRATVEAVFDYLSSIIEDTGSADILFNQSETDGTGALGYMGPFFWPGNCVDPWTVIHITTGVDPSPTGQFPDGRGTMDFGYDWNSDLGLPAPDEYDLFTVVLHEMTHALGFTTSLSRSSCPPSACAPVPGIAGRYEDFDPRLRQAGTGAALIDCFAGEYLGGDLEGAPGVVLDGPNLNAAWATVGGSGSPPLYTPDPWTFASLAHFDDGPSMPAGVVMTPTTTIGTARRELHQLDKAALADIGFQIAGVAPTGACCLPSGSCVDDQTSEECVGQGGAYQGDASSCGSVSCAEPTGACCLASGDCLNNQTSGSCAGQGGAYQGDASSCGSVSCPQPSGACCLASGDCLDGQPVADCAAQGGAFQGDGSSCGGVSCPQPTGACCLPGESCVNNQTSAGCSGQGGEYQGHGTGCGGVDCSQPTGACCLADGNCLGGQTSVTCAGQGGAYQGNGSACAGVSCPEPTGACCLASGGCLNSQTSAACTGQGGVYQGDGTNCGGVICPQPTGACCLPGGACSDGYTLQQCSDGGGQFHLDQACSQVSCGGGGEAGDCCLPNGTPGCEDPICQEAVCAEDPSCCTDVWDAHCALLATVYCAGCSNCCVAHDGPSCDNSLCVEAVCFEDIFCCTVEWDSNCADLAGQMCPVCIPAGDCCEANGTPSCEDPPCVAEVCFVDFFCCGIAWDTSCAELANELCPVCMPAGDCCEANGTPSCDDSACLATVCYWDIFCCTVEWDSSCAEFANEVCEVCTGAPSGACCLLDGSCVSGMTSETCAYFSGVYEGDGTTCASPVCPQPTGACCLASGACADGVTFVGCYSQGGAFQGAGTSCGGTSCPQPTGACCMSNGDCLGGYTHADCVSSWGSYQGNGTTCAGVACPPAAGDCCATNETPGCAEPACQSMVCALDPFCCIDHWDQLCANLANEVCGPCANDCCAVHETPGCGDPACQELVCAQYPLCCGDTWDEQCASLALAMCDGCFADVGSDCCVGHLEGGCDDPACQEAVCLQDPYCCNSMWDSFCANQAIAICGVCGSTCAPDSNGDSDVNVDDLVNVILDWSTDGSSNGGDVDGSGVVDVDDLLFVILEWGPCD